MDEPRVPERVRNVLPTAIVGLLAGVAGTVGSYAAAGFMPTFVVSPVATALRSVMPDIVIRYAITVLGSLGEKLHLLTAFLVVIGGIAVIVTGLMLLGRRFDLRTVPVMLTLFLVWGGTAAITGNPLLALGAGLPASLVVLIAQIVPILPIATSIDETRRTILASAISVLGFSAVGYSVGSDRTTTTEELDTESADTATSLLEEADQKSLGVAGMEPLVSEEFYTVDYSAVDPAVKKDEWELTITGEVEEEVSLTFEDITAMESEQRFETLRCVGESLNGKKMDTALWTGVPIMDLVEQAGPKSGCGCVMFRAADDYYEEFPIEAMEDGLLAYGMNETELPRAHGHPVRALIPGHWGEISVKWITEIEILDKEMDGYWETRGWHGTGPVNTVAKLHATNDLDDGRKEVAGHAYAGVRGIQKVEVSTDGGSTWNEAELSETLPGIDVWQQWRYTYEPPDGSHEVVVRATDGTGTLQTREETNAYPSGPTGWVSTTVN